MQYIAPNCFRRNYKSLRIVVCQYDHIVHMELVYLPQGIYTAVSTVCHIMTCELLAVYTVTEYALYLQINEL